jgi:RHS repeat-associated protein
VIQGTYGKELTRSEYDYANPAPGTLLRTTTSAYLALSNSTYLTANLIDLPSSVQIKDGGGTQRAYTTYAYDETGSPAGAHGNLTSIHRWLNTTGGYLVTSNVYNSNGLVTSSTDPKTNPTSFGYTGSYAGSGPTTITNALNQSVTNVYDSNTGLLTSTTDPNSKTTSYQYDDMLRTTQVSYPDGGLTTFTYFPVFQGGAYVYIAEKMDASGDDRDTTAWVDGVGREGRVAISNGETLNYDEPTDICYDGLGRVAFSAYPFQDDGWSAPRSCTIAGDSFTYDGLSRTIKVTHSDGSFISTSYSGNSTTVTDEQGKTRESYSDGLGRLSQVIENPGGLNYTTAYTYDALNNLTGVTQASSRQRTFVYDSLSRLISSTNPEANWAPSTQTSVATTYAYDADGNLVNKTEPAPNQQSTSTVTLTYCYDALNRMTAKGYTSQTCANGLLPTPVATYVYDAGALPAGCSVGSFSYGLAIGKRTAMCDAAGSEAWSYTIVSGTGWQTTDQRTTNGLTKNAVYQNNFLGLPASVQYPSGRTITYGYNVGARPISATDGTTSVSYAKTVHYLANGARCWAVLGGAATGAETFNGRLQPLEMQATSAVVAYPGTGCPGLGQTGNLQDVSYNFDLGSGDNGNVMGITNNRDTTRSQAFSYDALNRIVTATASTYAGSPAHCWGEAYQFDNQTTGGAWGNLTSIGVASTSYNGCTQESLSVTATAQNRVSTSGYYYDTAGNLTTISGATYSFDAENHLTSTAGVNYTYDGDGKRVEKSNGKIYWYGMDGYVLDETDLTGSTTNSSFNEYVFFGENRIARRDSSNNVYYYASDHLGTSRVIAEVPSGSTTATLCYDADFYPFGGERPYTNSCTQNYKFTAKERDSESGLDNFAARYDSSSMARFMSPDEIGPGQHPGAPQTWNLYSYVNNNPLTLTDPSGRYTCDKNTMTQAQCDAFQAGLIQAQADADKLKDKYGANSKQYKDAQNAINSFGREGVDNGVHIAFGDTGKYAATTTYGPFAGSTQNNPDGQNITVTLNSDHPSLAGDALTEAHEGSHVYDLSGWIMSVGAPSMDITSRETENRAYNVTANLASVDSRFNAWYTINFDNPTRGYLIFSNDPSWNQDMQDRFVGILINSEYSDPNKRLDSFYRNTNPGR